ncbi:MAG: phosphodiesterase [Acetobacteraceae bacterium]|nr:phosphodiesterase [Acetobacteraceae bacterium]
MLICQLSDMHLCRQGEAAYRVVETHMLTERAFRAVAGLYPHVDALLLTGDLTFDGQEDEYQELLMLLRRHIECPVYVIPGNHDRRVPLRKQLAELPGVARHPRFIQYAIEDLPARIVMLDTLVEGANHGELCAERLDWLDRTLAAVPGKPTILAMHHPPFAGGIGYMDQINLRNADAFRAVVQHHKQVERIICGHVHRPITARFAQAVCSVAPSTAHQLELTLAPGARGAFVMEPAAAHLHRWTAQDGFVSHVAYVEPFPGPYPFSIDSSSTP